MNMMERDRLLLAAGTDLRATDEGGYLLTAKAARHLADILDWVANASTLALSVSATALAECLVIDDSERTS